MRALAAQARSVAARRKPRAHPGRDRHGQGRARRVAAPRRAARRGGVRRPELRRASRASCWRRSCSATSGARSPARSRAKPGLLEIAHRGTLFLDEIGDMDLEVQPKLLKVLEEQRFRRLGDVRERQVDVRLIAATHHDLGALVQREAVPQRPLLPHQHAPARACRRCASAPEDIPPPRAPPARQASPTCAARRDHALHRRGRARSASYPWPGNMRELRNVLERAVLLSEKQRARRARPALRQPRRRRAAGRTRRR